MKPGRAATSRRTSSRRSRRDHERFAEPLVRRYRPGWAGSLYLLTTLFLALGAINSQNNLLFWAFGLAIAGMLVSGFISGLGLMGIQIRRLAVHEARVGEPTSLRYRLWNRNRLIPACAVTVEELERETRRHERESWPERFARPLGYVSQVGARRTATGEAVILPAARGMATLRVLRITSTFPFGLMRKSIDFEQSDRLTILPARVGLSVALRHDVRVAAESGTQVSTRVGSGEDFFGVREYVPGDPTRKIAWRASARVGELLVLQTSAPSPRRLWVLLDLRGPGSTDWSIELAIAAAAALLHEASDAGFAVGLGVPGFGIIEVPRQGPRYVGELERRLALIDPAEPSESRSEIPRRSLLRESFFIIHAGELEPGFGPRESIRRSALDPARLVSDPASLPQSLRPCESSHAQSGSGTGLGDEA